MRRTAVGKTLIVLLAILVVTALSLSIAVASGKSASAPAAAPDGGGKNACPDSSKNPNGTPPNCGHAPDEPPPPDECNDGIDNDEDGATDGFDRDCDDGSPESGSDEPACSNGVDDDEDGATDGDDPDCDDDDDTDEGGTVTPPQPSCGDPDGDGVDHSAFDNDSNEGGPVSSIVHEVDQAIPSPLAGDQGVVTEVNCAIVVTVEELLGING